MKLNIDKNGQRFLDHIGHLLVLGGPGSGKTTISLLKAAKIVSEENWNTHHRVLFLSFARATITRVVEHLQTLVPQNNKSSFEINTYHGFCWKIIKSHGYLLSKKRAIKLLDPSAASAELAHIQNDEYRLEHLKEIFENAGILGFDLFAYYTSALLQKSSKIRKLVSQKYPVIIVDEFQDTNHDEWALIKLLGIDSKIIALADPEQRIYEFRGADPARVREFSETFKPETFDFGSENHRSTGTDITEFGNDVLLGKNKGKTYQQVDIIKHRYYKNREFFILKTQVLLAIKRLKKLQLNEWSIAVLVPTKLLMVGASDYFLSNKDSLQSLNHEVAVDSEGPSLGAIFIASLLEGAGNSKQLEKELAERLMDHMRGRTGKAPAKTIIDISNAVLNYYSTNIIKGRKRIAITKAIETFAYERSKFVLSGNPYSDWESMIEIIYPSAEMEVIKNVLIDVKFVRFLTKGSNLRNVLVSEWKLSKSYKGAQSAFRLAIQQEHFNATTRRRIGINIMTIHKSKGKEFDEVIMYEGYHQGRYVKNETDTKIVEESKRMIRVGVTRAMRKTTILTPASKPCPLL